MVCEAAIAERGGTVTRECPLRFTRNDGGSCLSGLSSSRATGCQEGDDGVARTNYSYEKRQKELAKKKKKEQKRQRKLEKKKAANGEEAGDAQRMEQPE